MDGFNDLSRTDIVFYLSGFIFFLDFFYLIFMYRLTGFIKHLFDDPTCSNTAYKLLFLYQVALYCYLLQFGSLEHELQSN